VVLKQEAKKENDRVGHLWRGGELRKLPEKKKGNKKKKLARNMYRAGG